MDKSSPANLDAIGADLFSALTELIEKHGREKIRGAIHFMGANPNPVDYVRWVPIDQVQANDYNPNSVATNEMKLLYLSIKNDGYTQPIVTIWDEELKKFIIVDGFHRYTTMRINPDLLELNGGLLPIVVLNKGMNDRMASTVRHNRARGKHSVNGMSNMVFNMLQNGMDDATICNELGMEADELVRLKHITGFSKLFKDTQYSRAWVTERQIVNAKAYADKQKEGQINGPDHTEG